MNVYLWVEVISIDKFSELERPVTWGCKNLVEMQQLFLVAYPFIAFLTIFCLCFADTASGTQVHIWALRRRNVFWSSSAAHFIPRRRQHPNTPF
jgi:hypothetical protein